jgi:DNA-directed RNA polymerase II subunit RPB3
MIADVKNTGETSYMLQPVKIMVLAPGQEIKLRAIARKGVGKDHAKWIPVATAVLARMPDIQINEPLMNTLTEEQKQEFVDSCPQKVFGISPVTNAVRPAGNPAI